MKIGLATNEQPPQKGIVLSVNKGGRPTKAEVRSRRISKAVSKQTPEVVKKLEEAFAIDATIGEACFYADISERTYYNWIKANPDLLQRFTALRNKPVLLARQTIVKSLENSPGYAFRYMERKRPDEWSTKTKVEHSGSVDTGDGDKIHDKKADEIRKKYEEELKKEIITSRERKDEDGEK